MTADQPDVLPPHLQLQHPQPHNVAAPWTRDRGRHNNADDDDDDGETDWSVRSVYP